MRVQFESIINYINRPIYTQKWKYFSKRALIKQDDQSDIKGEEGVGAQDDTEHGQSLLAPEQIHHHVVGEDDGHPV